ncbi:4a-hydroxytetrahydrobiopterin dehydratase [Temperatibacter marinus]|uniref:Putative pterin-4-alpha-carbinolamine dehydratase n=1 Tax=Temperatibacter marinus TaxID=1456591 RepID=A0AA52HA86_9PROT|nr:4a-hydroxytetrahydrobiopterin dehydratase [Temperatibacter marinus]WND03367.1 4a-hydroxytetrahydrobiopterin dehydratase [Temperatibacter marinus]
MSRAKLSEGSVVLNLQHLKGWTLSDCKQFIERELAFKDFRAAWAFMNKVAEKAEALDHHPNWSNVYNRVHISLTTHDSGGLSELDFALAHHIDDLLDNQNSNN